MKYILETYNFQSETLHRPWTLHTLYKEVQPNLWKQIAETIKGNPQGWSEINNGEELRRQALNGDTIKEITKEEAAIILFSAKD